MSPALQADSLPLHTWEALTTGESYLHFYLYLIMGIYTHVSICISVQVQEHHILYTCNTRTFNTEQILRWLDGITDAMDMNLGKFQEMVKEACCAAVHGTMKRSDMTWQLFNTNNCLVLIKYPSSHGCQ